MAHLYESKGAIRLVRYVNAIDPVTELQIANSMNLATVLASGVYTKAQNFARMDDCHCFYGVCMDVYMAQTGAGAWSVAKFPMHGNCQEFMLDGQPYSGNLPHAVSGHFGEIFVEGTYQHEAGEKTLLGINDETDTDFAWMADAIRFRAELLTKRRGNEKTIQTI